MDWDETLARVRRAAAFCVDAGLERFRIDEDELTIEVRRQAVAAPAAPAPVAAEPASDGPALNGVAAHASAARVLKAEFVGILRFSRPAVAEGDAVEAGRELAYVEALGIRNPVRAAAAGTLTTVFVGDGQAVEYGQPLFALEDATEAR